jgi:hypothetical protein
LSNKTAGRFRCGERSFVQNEMVDDGSRTILLISPMSRVFLKFNKIREMAVLPIFLPQFLSILLTLWRLPKLVPDFGNT